MQQSIVDIMKIHSTYAFGTFHYNFHSSPRLANIS